MKTNILVPIAFFVFLSGTYAQEKIDLEPPAYPARAILGSPGLEINRVGSYSALITSLTSEISPSSTSIPVNLGLEFTPYYFESRAGAVEDLNKPNIWRDLRFSLATTEVEAAGEQASFTRMGIGLRTYLLPGKFDEKVVRGLNAEASFPTRLERVAEKLKEEVKFEEEFLEKPQFSLSDDQRLIILYEIKDMDYEKPDEIAEKLNTLAAKIRNQTDGSPLPDSLNFYKFENRWGSFLQLGGAIAVDFPTGDAGYQEVNRWGVWLSYHYVPKKKRELQISVLGRFSNYSFDPNVIRQDFYYLDGGLNVTLPIMEKFKLTVEGIARLGLGSVNTVENEDGTSSISLNADSESKLDFTLSYLISEQVLLQLSVDQFFGKWTLGEVDPTQLLLGVNYALGGN